MTPLFISWTDFKAFVDARELVSIQYVETDDKYFLRAADGFFLVGCDLIKDGGSDQTDFENNYQSASNVSPTQYMTPSEGTRDYTFNGDVLELDVACPAPAAGPKVTNVDLKLTGTTALNGGFGLIYQNYDARDFVKFELIDIDNVLGGGANQVLTTFVEKWRIPDNTVFQIYLDSLNYVPAANLYLRMKITHHFEGVGVNIKGWFNLFKWKK